jgi:hypothetical protein
MFVFKKQRFALTDKAKPILKRTGIVIGGGREREGLVTGD